MSELLTFGDMSTREDIFHYSVATWATAEFLDKRSQLMNNADCNKVCVQCIAEFGFLALAIVSVIEGLARAIFGIIIGAPLNYCCCSDWAWSRGAGGAVVTMTNAAICFVALYENFCHEELDHDQILPCAAAFVDRVTGSEVDSDDEH